jgi:uncharacterized protein YqjF (DUF2071 family)
VAQSWLDLLFAHWSVERELIRRLVPPVLELDTFEDRYWVGVVPFRMRTVRFAGCPPVPGTSAFPEINVRTYVKHDGRPGVFFLSLDAGNPIAVTLGRRMYGLPYVRAEITMRTDPTGVTTSSERTETAWPPAAFAASYGPQGSAALAAPGTLEHWLTERYCFYTATPAQGIRRTDIHHLPWQLQPAVLDLKRNSLLEPFAINVTGEPLLHFSAAQHVVAWGPVAIAA